MSFVVQADDGIRVNCLSGGLGGVYKGQWSGLLEGSTESCATGRPTSQAVSGDIKARATTVGATWSASTVRHHEGELDLTLIVHGLRRRCPSAT